MKRNILARRAASAALAACMMFSLSAPALAASTDALLQQSTAAKSAVSVLDEENGMTEEPVYDEMDLNRGSITVYIGEDGKQYAKQGENDPQKRGNLQITTDGGRTDNTLTIEGGTTGAKVTLSNVNIDAPGRGSLGQRQCGAGHCRHQYPAQRREPRRSGKGRR